MSLDFDLSKIINRDKSQEGWEVTQSVIFATMSVDLGEITEENVAEFYARYLIFNRAVGSEPYLTLDHIKWHVGLRVNVITKTRAAWLNKIKKILDQEMFIMIRRQKSIMKLEADALAKSTQEK